MKRQLTRNYRQQIIEMYEQGYRHSQIASMLCFKPETIREYIRKLIDDGVVTEDNMSDSGDKRRAILDAYENGERDIKRLQMLAGCEVAYVYRTLGDRPFDKARTPTTLAIIEELRQQTPPTEIVKKYNVSRQYVYRLKKNLSENT